MAVSGMYTGAAAVITATSAIESLVSEAPRNGTKFHLNICQDMVEYTLKLNESFN